MTAPLINSLNLAIKGVESRVRLASLIMLGLELDHLKRLLGYVGEGSWQQFREESKSGERLTWPQYCRAQSGFSDRSVQNFYECGEAVKQQLRYSRRPESKALLEAMALQPSELTREERESLLVRIARIGLTNGDTQTYLKKVYRAANPSNEGKPLGVNAWPEDDAEERHQKALRILPVVKEEAERRKPSMEDLARLAMKALEQLKADGKLLKYFNK